MMRSKIYGLIILFSGFTVLNINAQNLENCRSFKQSLNDDAILYIDPKIEFFHIFNLIAGNPNINRVDTDYKTDIINYFSKYRNHPSIQYYRVNFQKFFNSIDAPYSLLHSLKQDFTFREDVIENKWKDHNEIDILLSAFNEFATDSDFANFFNSQSNFYSLLISNTAYTLSDFNERERMLTYYGLNKNLTHSFHVIINVLGMGNFGTGLKTEIQKEHFAVVSPGRSISGIPLFSKKEIESLIWHEFGHSFTNPLVDQNWTELSSLKHLNVPIQQSMSSQSYHEWKTVLYEHLTRALTCRFQADKYGELYAKLNQERVEVGRRFIYVKPIIERLKYYEQNRTKYPDLNSFMPEILDALKKVSNEDVTEWTEDVKAIRMPDVEDIPENANVFQRENQLMILSTSELDSIADSQLKEYVTKIFPDMPTMYDTTALKRDLSQYNLFVIGSYNGNEFIKKYLKSLPIYIDSTQVTAGKQYSGKGYSFLTGWVNPHNIENVITFYIAQSPKDLLNFAWVPRGSTDYHLMKDLITLKADDYKRIMKIWRIE